MKIMNVVGFTIAAFTFVLLIGGMARADEIFYSVKGAVQGQFKGESVQKGREKFAPVRKFQYGVVTPYDAASGQATGRRKQHGPVVITKAWGASSPQLFQALVNNERLSEVVIDFYVLQRNNTKRGHSIKLTDANIVEIAYATETAKANGLLPIESVSFTFQKIEYMDGEGNVTASDNFERSPI